MPFAKDAKATPASLRALASALGLMKILHKFLIIFIFLYANFCVAHEDTIIGIGSDGALEGIPNEFGPGRLSVNFSSSETDSASITSIDLVLGKNRTHLPICVTGLLETKSASEIRASASWYHNESHLPYYIEIMFYDPGYDSTRNSSPGFSLLFNLRTGKLIRMEVLISRDSGQSIQMIPVAISSRCKPNEFRGFSDAE